MQNELAARTWLVQASRPGQLLYRAKGTFMIDVRARRGSLCCCRVLT